jgi:NAD(P)-dependent dehydrogenase (short-subunit alcohol dehydrogenase family)
VSRRTFEGTRFDLTGRTAIITGGAGLLGRQHAAALLELGAAVVLLDVDRDRLIAAREELRRAHMESIIETEVADVCEKASLVALEEQLRARSGGVDILINNAAIDSKVTASEGLGHGSRLEQFSLDDWNHEIAVGLTGAFLCSQVFGTAMARKGRGSIVNVASDLAIISPDQRLYELPGLPPSDQPVKPVTYSVIKTALIGLTRYLATYWATNGVRVNAISPGGVFNGQPEDFVRRLTSRIPMERMANVDEYRCAIQFLSSDASSYMTGHNLVVDGGRTVW